METQADKDLSWATKVAEILTDGQREIDQEIEKLEYKWKVERTAYSLLAMPEKYRDEELAKLDFWFRLDIHRQMTGHFDGVSMAQKSIDEERQRGWSTD